MTQWHGCTRVRARPKRRKEIVSRAQQSKVQNRFPGFGLLAVSFPSSLVILEFSEATRKISGIQYLDSSSEAGMTKDSFLLYMGESVGHITANFFPWIKDILRIKNFLHVLKKSVNFFAVHIF